LFMGPCIPKLSKGLIMHCYFIHDPLRKISHRVSVFTQLPFCIWMGAS